MFVDSVDSDDKMSNEVRKVRREAVEPCMTCPLCHKLVRDATTVIECLHTFCKKCIYKKLTDEEMECCPKCNIGLGCVPLDKLRPDHNMQDIRAKLFPDKRIKLKAAKVVSPVLLPAKRKERSLLSLVVSTPRVATQIGMTGRRSKSMTGKASRGFSFTIERPVMDSIEDHPESSCSPETLNKFTQHMRRNCATGEASNQPNPDEGKKKGSEHWEGKVDLWKPLTCLVEAANRIKSSKSSLRGSLAKSEAPHCYGNKDFLSKSKYKKQRKKANVKDERNRNDGTPPESERPKKLCKIHQRARDFGEFRVPPQVMLDAASAKCNRINYPIWLSLVATDALKEDAPVLPQISASYLRIKDGSVPVSFILKYLKKKLDLTSEDEVEIKCMGQTVIPTLSLDNLVDLWLQTTSTERVSVPIGSSAKDFVMVLRYAHRVPGS